MQEWEGLRENKGGRKRWKVGRMEGWGMTGRRRNGGRWQTHSGRKWEGNGEERL